MKSVLKLTHMRTVRSEVYNMIGAWHRGWIGDEFVRVALDAKLTMAVLHSSGWQWVPVLWPEQMCHWALVMVLRREAVRRALAPEDSTFLDEHSSFWKSLPEWVHLFLLSFPFLPLKGTALLPCVKMQSKGPISDLLKCSHQIPIWKWRNAGSLSFQSMRSFSHFMKSCYSSRNKLRQIYAGAEFLNMINDKIQKLQDNIACRVLCEAKLL